MPLSKHKKTRILIFGTFDGIHPGHMSFFRQARRLAKHPLLVVSVARDKNVKKIKGKKPRINEKRRLANISKLESVDRAVLGAPKDYISHIIKLKPNIIALGYDQTAYTDDLKLRLRLRGLNVLVKKLKAYKPHLYKSSKMGTDMLVES